MVKFHLGENDLAMYSQPWAKASGRGPSIPVPEDLAAADLQTAIRPSTSIRGIALPVMRYHILINF